MFQKASKRKRFLLRVGLYGGFLFVGVPLAFAWVMTRTFPLVAPSPPPPEYEEIHLTSESLRLRAWLAAGSPERAAVVVVHGLGDSLEAYLGHARPFRERGHSVILVDLRGHGASEGRVGTLGAREPADVQAAMGELRRRRLADRGIILMGHSMGAVAALRAAADAEDVAAVVVEAPYDSYRSAVTHHAWELYKVPSWAPIIPLAIAAAEWRGGFEADDVDVVAAARRVRAPLMAIADALDRQMPEEMVRRVFDAHAGPKAFWLAPGVGHIQSFLLPERWQRIEEFLEQNGL